jgi:hypothetical protein
MTTLQIEHAISDYGTWLEAFNRFGEARAEAGVTAYRVFRPVDDDHYVVVHLDFEHATRASAFLETLRTRIWSNPTASPALRGQPRTAILERADQHG